MADTTINDKMLSSLKSLVADKSTSSSLKTDLNLQMTDWMTLLIAQLKNQDMDNQVDTTEMMSQIAQFSQIQATQELVSMAEDMYATNITSYAASLVGKDATAASIKTTTTTSGTTEELVTVKGKITGVTLFEGEPYVYIGGEQFSLSQIMIVGEVENETAGEETGKEENGGSTVETGGSTVETENKTEAESGTATGTDTETKTEAE